MNTQEFYSQISSRYYAETFGQIGSTRSLQRHLRTAAVLRMVDRWMPKSGAIADIGCGPAQYAQPLMERGHSYVGIDIAEEMFRAVAARLANEPRVSFRVGSISELPVDDQTIDVALVIGVLEYIRSDEKSLTEIRRVLKPEGIAIISLPNLLNPFHALRTLSRPIVAPLIRTLGPNSALSRTVYVSKIPYRVFIPHRWTRSAERAGFKLEEEYCHGYDLDPWDAPISERQLSNHLRREQIGTRWLPSLGSNFVVCLRKA